MPPDYTKCDAKQLDAWTKAETKYGGACPSSGDQGAIQTQAIDDAAAVAAELAGAPLCGNGGDQPGRAVRRRQPQWPDVRDAGL